MVFRLMDLGWCALVRFQFKVFHLSILRLYTQKLKL